MKLAKLKKCDPQKDTNDELKLPDCRSWSDVKLGMSTNSSSHFSLIVVFRCSYSKNAKK